ATRLPAAHQIRRPRPPTVLIGAVWDDDDEPQPWVRGERVGEAADDGSRPEILVFDVDQTASTGDHLLVGARDAALAACRERIAEEAGRVGPQHLHRCGAAPWRRPELGRQRIAGAVLPTSAGANAIDGG